MRQCSKYFVAMQFPVLLSASFGAADEANTIWVGAVLVLTLLPDEPPDEATLGLAGYGAALKTKKHN